MRTDKQYASFAPYGQLLFAAGRSTPHRGGAAASTGCVNHTGPNHSGYAGQEPLSTTHYE